MDEHRLYTEKEAARYLGYKVGFIRKQRKAGLIQCYKHGRSIRYSQKHLDDWLRSREKPLGN